MQKVSDRYFYASLPVIYWPTSRMAGKARCVAYLGNITDQTRAFALIASRSRNLRRGVRDQRRSHFGFPMTQLDVETADLIAARGVQHALALHPAYLSETVPLTVVALLAADRIDVRIADYVMRNADRFCLVPSPVFIDAKWHVDANALARIFPETRNHPTLCEMRLLYVRIGLGGVG